MSEKKNSKIRKLTKKDLKNLFGGKGVPPPPPAQDPASEDSPSGEGAD